MMRYQFGSRPLVIRKVNCLCEKAVDGAIEEYGEMPQVVCSVFERGRNHRTTPNTAVLLDCTDRRDNLIVTDSVFGEAERLHLCLYFSVYSREETEICMLVYSSASVRLWKNGSFFSIFASMVNSTYTLKLERGNNDFCFEVPCAARGYCMSVRMNSLAAEREHPEQSLCFHNLLISEGDFFLRQKDILLSSGEEYWLMPIPNDTLHIPADTDLWLTIRDTFDGRVLRRMKCKPLVKSTVRLSELNLNPARIHHRLELRFRYRLSGGKTKEKRNLIYVGDAEGFYESVVSRAEAVLSRRADLSPYAVSAIERTAEIVRSRTCDWFETAFELERILGEVDRGTYEASLVSPGVHTVYMRSGLDGNLIQYQVRVPKRYTKSKQYPLLMIFPISEFSSYSAAFEAAPEEFDDLICVDATCRGITLGSYVGEASVREILDEVCGRYSVDPLRIYGMGHSSGASACIVQAQIRPHLYAGLYACGGYLNTGMVQNYANTNAVLAYADREIFSGHDRKRFFVALRKNFPSGKRIIARGLIHSQLSCLQMNTVNLSKVLSGRLDPFPRLVRFRTERNRHLRAYWVTLFGIRFGKRHADVRAEYGKRSIRITVRNDVGFRIDLPPYLDRSGFSVTVNRRVWQFRDFCGDCLYFLSERGGHRLTDREPPVPDLYKGNGLLDVYLSPMKVVCTRGDRESLRVAKAFSEPKSNGYQPHIYVRYPVCDLRELETEDASAHSYVLIDCNSDSLGFPEEIRRNAVIRTDCDGYEYRGNYTRGRYCVMQVLPNPRNPRHSILYISCNSPALLARNFFLRRVVLPTYTYGLHPYCNNDALIYDGEHYRRIVEYGTEPETVTL